MLKEAFFMKKLLTIILSTLLLACTPTTKVSNYSYKILDSTTPQETVNELLGYESDMYKWPTIQYKGVYRKDSMIIVNRVFYKELSDTLALSITVTEYELNDTCTIKFKPVKLK